jgi:predicted transcriptional regulator
VSISAEDRKEMSAELDISKVTITQCLKELVTKKLISGKGGSYVINPQIF